VNRRRFMMGASLACSSALARRSFSVPPPHSDLQARVRAQLHLGVEKGLTVGAVTMVVQNGQVKVLDAAGYADRESKRPMNVDATFDIRSISKPITVLGALLLVQDKKLSLDDSLSTILPEFSDLKVAGLNAGEKPQPSRSVITLRQLMTHTSGIAAQRPAEIENITRTFDHTLAEAVALVAKQPLDFVPGTGWAYSSSGIAVLGRVIEVVSAQPFEQFMANRLFEPLQMRDTSFFPDPSKLNRIPTMYNLENGHLVKDVMDVTRPNQKYSAPDFGLFSTAEDLRHLAQMMLNRGKWGGRPILSAALIDQATRPWVQTAVPKYHAGLGWAVHTGNEPDMSFAVTDLSYGANGASSGILWIDPAIQLIRIYLTHYFGDGEFADGNPVMNAAFPRQLVNQHHVHAPRG
jgi:CubicO group peptidase (beta-lactamase class C family)